MSRKLLYGLNLVLNAAARSLRPCKCTAGAGTSMSK